MRALVVAGLLGACGGGKGGAVDGRQMAGQVGRVCDPGTVGPNETVVASPALECESNLCLAIASSQPPMCTATCVDDTDCSASIESACPSGFTCAPVVSVGPLGCGRFCVCSDRVPPTSCL